MGFSQPLSGLSAQSQNLDVISNNIANSQTVGFKAGDALFADVFAGANSKIGLGTRVSDIRQDFTAGGLESTGRQLDLAISGEGFFRLEQPNGEAVYSRNGQFNQDADGFIVNATGQRVTGFPESGGAEPEPIQIDRAGLEAQATGRVEAVYNLDARASSAAADQQSVTLENTDGDDVGLNYNFANSFTTYDSLGNQRVVSGYFTKTPGVNTWKVEFAVDGVIDRESQVQGEYNLNNTDSSFSDRFTVVDNDGEPRFVTAQFNALNNGDPNEPNTFDDGVEVTFTDGNTSSSSELLFDGDGVFDPVATPDSDADGTIGVSLTDPALSDINFDFNLTDTTRSENPSRRDFLAGTPNTYEVAFNNDGTLNTGASSVTADGVLDNAISFRSAKSDGSTNLFGAEPNNLAFNFDLSGATQFAGGSTQNSLSQNGYAPGSLAGFEVQDDGTIQKNYTNGESRDAGQIALASFVNPEGLQPDGDNNFQETAVSGPANNGVAGAGLLGTIESGVVESSNVDLATELVDTIVAQRAYQANSTSISTQDELLQTVIQL